MILISPPPDSKTRPSILIYEFARCYTIEPEELDSITTEKRNQYHALTTYLRRHPDYRHTHDIHSQQYILSVLGVIPPTTWTTNFETLRLTSTQQDNILETCLHECIIAGHHLNNTAHSLQEAQRARGHAPQFPHTGIG